MSTRVKILPENLTNKIAAGEVVERPASVVKELVENALDAGCGEVVVEIEGGGKKLIRITDNGSGMSREDALLALERHATSKISTDTDLFNLVTLGFRGEALPSIASVSRFTLATREEAHVEGCEIYAEGGRIREVKVCGMAPGTVVSVRNLFFNTPARLKFMKSSDTEGGHVGEFLTRLAISRPDVRFTYMSDGRTVFRAREGNLRERVLSLLGSTFAAELYLLHVAGDGLSVSGLVAPPSCSRSTASHFYTYINGRFIRDRVVQHAILQAYRNFMERGRYPLVVLFVEVPPGEVDVNVHPTKHEVRFREQGRVHDAIQGAVESVLRGAPWMKSAPVKVDADPALLQAASGAHRKIDQVRESLSRYGAGTARQESFAAPPPPARPVLPEMHASLAAVAPSGYFSGLTVIGQFNAAYILCQDGTDLVLIDQHAAHERIAFEQLKARFTAGEVESQGLLFPRTIELAFREAATLTQYLDEFARLGFGVEHFGGSTWILNSVPLLLAEADYLRTFRDILEELEGLGRSGTFRDIQEETLVRIACHSVIRGCRSLTGPEISALLARMDAAEFASNCPHGRPVSRKIELAEIEKMFKRK